MKNLGKVWILLLFATLSYASGVTAQVERTSVTLGERLVLNLQVDGENIEEPKIGKLCGSEVLSTSRSTNMQIINGSYSKTQVLSYAFMPTESCRIEPIAVKIDGKYYSTEPIDITVKAMTISKESPFILTMESEKSSVYVGEPFKVTITLKQRHDAEAVDSKFLPPQMKNLWIKEQQQGRRFEEGDYSVTKITYIMAAQRAGAQHISKTQLQVAQRSHSRDAWGQWFPQLQWRSYFSNGLDIEAKALPEGVNLVGDFNATLAIDKQEIEANEAVNVVLRISGSGNFEDIGSLKPHIDGVSVYEEEPVTKGNLENGEYSGIWSQKMAMVSDHNYTIPPISLRYFDLKTDQIKTIQTNAISVHVTGAVSKKEQHVSVERPKEEPNTETKQTPQIQQLPLPWWAIALLGVFGGIIIALLPWQRLKVQRTHTPKMASGDKASLNVLLRHLDDPEAAQMAVLLERKLYEGDQTPIDKAALKKLLKRYM